MAKTPSRDDTLVKVRIRVGSTEIDYEGRESFLVTELSRVLDLITHCHNTQVKAASRKPLTICKGNKPSWTQATRTVLSSKKN